MLFRPMYPRPNILQEFRCGLFLVCVLLLAPSSSDSVQTQANFYGNPFSMGTASTGVGWDNPVASLYYNPAQLKRKEISVLDIGGFGSSQSNQHAMGQFSGVGGLYSMDSDWAFYGTYLPIYANLFPGDERTQWNRLHLGVAHNITKNFSWFLGLGPSLVQRNLSFSNWSSSGNLGIHYQYGNWTMGGSFEIPGRVQIGDYRGGDKLKETGPQRVLAGMGYDFQNDWSVYGEIRKIFYDQSRLTLNGDSVTPAWERGLGAEWSGSLSGRSKNTFTKGLQIFGGLEWGGVYSPRGKNLRSLGLGYGVGYDWVLGEPNPGGKVTVLSLQLGVFDTHTTAAISDRPGERQYSFSLTYRQESVP